VEFTTRESGETVSSLSGHRRLHPETDRFGRRLTAPVDFADQGAWACEAGLLVQMVRGCRSWVVPWELEAVATVRTVATNAPKVVASNSSAGPVGFLESRTAIIPGKPSDLDASSPPWALRTTTSRHRMEVRSNSIIGSRLALLITFLVRTRPGKRL